MKTRYVIIIIALIVTLIPIFQYAERQRLKRDVGCSSNGQYTVANIYVGCAGAELQSFKIPSYYKPECRSEHEKRTASKGGDALRLSVPSSEFAKNSKSTLQVSLEISDLLCSPGYIDAEVDAILKNISYQSSTGDESKAGSHIQKIARHKNATVIGGQKGAWIIDEEEPYSSNETFDLYYSRVNKNDADYIVKCNSWNHECYGSVISNNFSLKVAYSDVLAPYTDQIMRAIPSFVEKISNKN